MSRFTDHLGLTLLEDDDGRPVLKAGRCQWLVSAPLGYDVGAEGSGETIIVPTGFVTDLASIPRPAWWIYPPDGQWLKAAVVHDWLYATRGLCPITLEIGRYDRSQADAILREAMAVLGVPAASRAVIWAAVRVSGQGGWGRPAEYVRAAALLQAQARR
ncbi:hypothetical protein BH10PSE5_BH10PSE5_01400 [soil metagenome]